jgi:hypothetical protein
MHCLVDVHYRTQASKMPMKAMISRASASGCFSGMECPIFLMKPPWMFVQKG